MEARQRIVVALDASQTSDHLLNWVLNNVYQPAFSLHVITVVPMLPPLTDPIGPAPLMPMSTAAAEAISQHAYVQQKHLEEAADDILKWALHVISVSNRVPVQRVHAFRLSPLGGASGVAESIVAYAKAAPTCLVAVGARGLGSLHSALASLVGLGSVSAYCLHNLDCPTAVVKNPSSSTEQLSSTIAAAGGHGMMETEFAAAAASQQAATPRSIVLAYDMSPSSENAAWWMIRYLVKPGDHVHLFSVSLEVPFMDDTRQYHDQRGKVMAIAQSRCDSLAERLLTPTGGVPVAIPKEHMHTHVVLSDAGASHVGHAICHFSEQQKADVVVMGSRGLGVVKRVAGSLVGLGSVSDYCVQQLKCPVIVVKGEYTPARGGGQAAVA